MTGLLPKRWRRVRLGPETYRRLCQHVLERDKWCCQCCGRPSELQVHHITPRSQLGEDVEENLITLCAICHQVVHSRKKE